MASQHGDSSSHDQTAVDQEERPQCIHSGNSSTNKNAISSKQEPQDEPPKLERPHTAGKGLPSSDSSPRVVVIPKAQSHPESSITVPEQQQQQEQEQEKRQQDPTRNTITLKTFAIFTNIIKILRRLLQHLRNGLIAIALIVLSQFLIWGLDLVVKLVSDDFPAAIVGMILVFLFMYLADRIDGRVESWYSRTLRESVRINGSILYQSHCHPWFFLGSFSEKFFFIFLFLFFPTKKNLEHEIHGSGDQEEKKKKGRKKETEGNENKKAALLTISCLAVCIQANLINRHMSIGFTVPFVQAINLEFRDKADIGIVVGCFCKSSFPMSTTFDLNLAPSRTDTLSMPTLPLLRLHGHRQYNYDVSTRPRHRKVARPSPAVVATGKDEG